jgi:hypothetical protein
MVDGTAYISTHDTSQIVAVDLATREARVVASAAFVTRVLSLGDGRLALGRYSRDGEHAPLEIVDIGTPGGRSIDVGPVEAINPGPKGRIWAFEKTGEVVLADPAAGKVVGRIAIDIAPNEHIDLIGVGASVFASSDSTPVRRIGGSPLKVQATIQTGGGIPLAVSGGLVWGARPNELWAIDPRTDKVIQRIALTDVEEVFDLDIALTDVWIAIRHPGRIGAVIRVDLATGAVRGDFPVLLPPAVKIAGDRAWVTDFDSDTLVGFKR